MKNPAFFPLSLLLLLLCAGVAPVPPSLRALGGILLLGLWGQGLWQARGGGSVYRSPLGLLPGHALLFFGLGLVGSEAALWAWMAIPPATAALDLALRAGRRKLSSAFYAILWLDLSAVLHQLVALGRDLTGPALWAWSGGLGAFALAFVAIGMVRILGTSRN